MVGPEIAGLDSRLSTISVACVWAWRVTTYCDATSRGLGGGRVMVLIGMLKSSTIVRSARTGTILVVRVLYAVIVGSAKVININVTARSNVIPTSGSSFKNAVITVRIAISRDIPTPLFVKNLTFIHAERPVLEKTATQVQRGL
ncbi:hypothetical protein, unlikely [Trypanosoma congolense IL3000]|uniref:Uncharacterized protein n=1 Tax=Trypanosoma congolense (strain IL3000) TaxID=1068625 RepID=F9WJ41_TRYCI|nr:hypothetical protein, unlikely [Trypanosoma congolense IL3000]